MGKDCTCWTRFLQFSTHLWFQGCRRAATVYKIECLHTAVIFQGHSFHQMLKGNYELKRLKQYNHLFFFLIFQMTRSPTRSFNYVMLFLQLQDAFLAFNHKCNLHRVYFTSQHPNIHNHKRTSITQTGVILQAIYMWYWNTSNSLYVVLYVFLGNKLSNVWFRHKQMEYIKTKSDQKSDQEQKNNYLEQIQRSSYKVDNPQKDTELGTRRNSDPQNEAYRAEDSP